MIEKAKIAVSGFDKVAWRLEQQVALRGQSKSSLENYIRRIALISLHFGKLPHQIEEEEINEYLVALVRDPKSPSRSPIHPWFQTFSSRNSRLMDRVCACL